MSEDVRFVDLLFEQETNGRKDFKQMINNVFKVGFDASTDSLFSLAAWCIVQMACVQLCHWQCEFTVQCLLSARCDRQKHRRMTTGRGELVFLAKVISELFLWNNLAVCMHVIQLHPLSRSTTVMYCQHLS